MEIGDKAWYFDKWAEEIRSVTIQEVFFDSDGTRYGLFRDEYGIVHMYDRSFFPTREALCEHYRKIFE